MIRRECTTLAAAANSRLLICPLLGAGCSLAVERIGNVHNVRPTILSQVRAAASPDESAGGLAQHCDPQFPAETPVISAIAGGVAAGQLCGMMRTGWSAMIRKQEKPIGPVPTMSPGEYEAAVAAFIRSKGVTRCPTACLVRTQASVPAADRAALERYEASREQSRRGNLAVVARPLGALPLPDAR